METQKDDDGYYAWLAEMAAEAMSRAAWWAQSAKSVQARRVGALANIEATKVYLRIFEDEARAANPIFVNGRIQ